MKESRVGQGATSVLLLLLAATMPVRSGADDLSNLPKDLFLNFWLRAEGRQDAPGSVMRMDIDITGDGKPELLLANSQNRGTAGFDEWFVYTPLAERRYRFVGSMAFFGWDFLVDRAPCRVVALLSRPVALVQYEVSAAAITSREIEEPIDIDALTGRFKAWREEVGLQVLAIAPSALAPGSEPEWTDLVTGRKVPTAGNLRDLVVSDEVQP